MKSNRPQIKSVQSAPRPVKNEGSKGLVDFFAAIGNGIAHLFSGSSSRTKKVAKQIQNAGQNANAEADIRAAIEQVSQRRGISPAAVKSESSAKVSGTKAHAARSYRSSAQSLESLLDEMWSKRDQSKSERLDAYSLYCAPKEPNIRTMPREAYLGAVADIAKQRPANAVSNLQSFGGGGDSISEVVDMYTSGQLGDAGMLSKDALNRTFYRFQRENWSPDKITERVYVNAKADHLPHLMRQVVQNIVDNPTQFPGVEMAKCSGPDAAGNRAENIVIYTQSTKASKKVLAEIKRLQAQSPKAFMQSVPELTHQVMSGVAIGMEPTQCDGRESFGSLRASALDVALNKAMQHNLDRSAFGAQARHELHQRGVDPTRPYRNLVR